MLTKLVYEQLRYVYRPNARTRRGYARILRATGKLDRDPRPRRVLHVHSEQFGHI